MLIIKERFISEIKLGEDVIVIADAKAPPMWARFYDLETCKPFFSGRDGLKKYTLAEIENERRIHYAWYGTWANELLLTKYPAWQKKLKTKKLKIAHHYPFYEIHEIHLLFFHFIFFDTISIYYGTVKSRKASC